MFNAYMTDEVVLVRKMGNPTWGENGYTRKTVRARVDDSSSVVYKAAGESKTLKAMVFIKDIEIEPSDRIEINGVEHPIVFIKKIRSFKKVVVTEVGVG